MTWYTRPHPTATPPFEGVSPALLCQKWHAYDGPNLETKESRSHYLKRVGRAVRNVADSATYRHWYASYDKALKALGVETLTAPTAGRLVAGMATNPALETGLQLHHLLGVPCLPGSAIKGLLHHVAELELSETGGVADGSLLEDEGALEGLLRRAKEIWTLFGSLTVEPAREVRDDQEERIGPETVRSKLLAWRREGRIPEALGGRVSRLLDHHTGGRLAFYDAVPVAGQSDLLEVDVLNPHYPLYYRSDGEQAPSDDQDPVPVSFLVVKAGVRFVFPWRLRSSSEEVDGQGEDREKEQVRGWFASALGGWGAGGKTAAGYGYFEVEDRQTRTRGSAETGDAGGGTEKDAGWQDSSQQLWRGARLTWVPNKGLLEARLEGKRAHTRGQELLVQLPDEVRQRLTRKKNRKTLVCDVEVIQQSAEWYDLVAIQYSPEES